MVCDIIIHLGKFILKNPNHPKPLQNQPLALIIQFSCPNWRNMRSSHSPNENITNSPHYGSTVSQRTQLLLEKEKRKSRIVHASGKHFGGLGEIFKWERLVRVMEVLGDVGFFFVFFFLNSNFNLNLHLHRKSQNKKYQSPGTSHANPQVRRGLPRPSRNFP